MFYEKISHKMKHVTLRIKDWSLLKKIHVTYHLLMALMRAMICSGENSLELFWGQCLSGDFKQNPIRRAYLLSEDAVLMQEIKGL